MNYACNTLPINSVRMLCVPRHGGVAHVGHEAAGQGHHTALSYMAAHAHRLRYGTLEAHKLSIGSGQVERAVRRVINLRCKAPGSFWTETSVSGLMPLRAAFRAGRWDEVMIGVVTGPDQTPRFAPSVKPQRLGRPRPRNGTCPNRLSNPASRQRKLSSFY